MLKIIIPREILDWMYKFKGSNSLPVLIIKSLAYIKNNNITLEELEKERHQKRGDNVRIETYVRTREDQDIC